MLQGPEGGEVEEGGEEGGQGGAPAIGVADRFPRGWRT
jgi:hypothetical protein